ncbi:hypothetical protein VI817_001626 [Penicillium citrinum]|nr:hypothetical protein VI817_001626 [Penicillium citrinum]
MSLVEEATRIAREFDYPAEQVQRGVSEYIRQLNEGLAKENTTLSQIPTFVTAVPNGTEKVRLTEPFRINILPPPPSPLLPR